MLSERYFPCNAKVNRTGKYSDESRAEVVGEIAAHNAITSRLSTRRNGITKAMASLTGAEAARPCSAGPAPGLQPCALL